MASRWPDSLVDETRAVDVPGYGAEWLTLLRCYTQVNAQWTWLIMCNFRDMASRLSRSARWKSAGIMCSLLALGERELAVDLGRDSVAVVDLLLVRVQSLYAVVVGPGIQGLLIH